MIDALLRKWLARLPHPYSPADRAAGYRYELSVLQAEFSLTQMLDKPVSGRIFFEQTIRDVGSRPMTAKAARRCGLTTMVAQSMPHAVHVHACTVGGAGCGCTPVVVPQPGQPSSRSMGSVTVDGPGSITGHPRTPRTAAGLRRPQV